MQSLTEAKAGEYCTIKWMFGAPEVLQFMRDRQIREGATIQVIQNSAGTLIIGTDRVRLAIGGEIAERIRI